MIMMIIHVLSFPIASVGGVFLGRYIYKKIIAQFALNKLTELRDCPFKFTVASNGSTEYIVFDLGNKVKLWCEYSFGVRCDGVYGVSYLELEGLNSRYGRTITLPIGCSVFPLIEKMEQFEKWADKKTLEYEWNDSFQEAWDEMKKKLDNLRFLETKSIEKEKKKGK